MGLHAPFPRASSAFVGRSDELSRIDELFGSEVMFLVYGVAGIGKTELVYKAFEAARERKGFRAAMPVLVQAHAGQRTDHLLSILRFRLTDKRRGSFEAAPSYEEDLGEVTRLLEARPHLVFVDDAHHLDDRAGAMIAHLCRHVRRSRIFVASRSELVLPPDAPPPAFVRLGSLDAAATGELVTALARRMDVAVPDLLDVIRRSGGSPFLVRRELARIRYLPGEAEERHDWTLSQLSLEARRALLLGRALRGRLRIDELEQHGFPKRIVAELARHFVIEVERGIVTVHDLIWEALRPLLADEEVDRARSEAGDLLLRRFREHPVGNAADCGEALLLYMRAGEPDKACEALRASYRAVAAAGLDHLLLDVLAELRRGRPRRLFVELVTARIHLRRSHVADAQAIVEALADDAEATASSRYWRLAGDVQQRAGNLAAARALFERADLCAASAAERFSTRLQRANAASLAGDTETARQLLAAARAELPAPKPVEVARWAWSQALSLLVDDRLDDAVETARRGARDFGDDDADARLLLALHEIIARVELDDVSGARALGDRVLHRAAVAGSLREQFVAVYRGALQLAEGDLVGARVVLADALDSLERQRDFLPATMAGYYLARALYGLGDLEAAQAIVERMLAMCRDGGLPALTATAATLRAHMLLAEAQPAAARAVAAAVAEDARVAPRTRAEAYGVVARSLALAGDLAGAHAAVDAAAGLLQAAPAGARPRWELMRVEVATWYGGAADVDLVAAVEPAVAWFAARGRRFDEARATTVLAAALLVRDAPGDDRRADRAIGRVQELTAAHAYGLVHLRALLLDAALIRRRGDERQAAALLAGAAAELAGEETFEALLVRAAVGSGEGAPPAVDAVLRRLGLRQRAHYELVTRDGVRRCNESEHKRLAAGHALVVDVDRGSLARGDGAGVPIVGRQQMAALVLALVQAGDGGVSAERLFYDVWRGREYNPLRHRNTIYVGITRLRKALRTLLPGRDIVETFADGWRLLPDADVCIVRRAPQSS